MPHTEPFTPLPALTPFTLFGVHGKMAEVHTLSKGSSDLRPWNWEADISPWKSDGPRIALALSGKWPSLPRLPTELPVNDPEAVAAVSDYLKKEHLQVP